MVEGSSAVQPTAVMTAGLLAVLGVMLRRSYEAFDVVVEAVENSTVQFVTAVGEESTKAVPVVFGMVLTLLLVVLKYIVQKYWTTRKERMMECGETPEGNMALAGSSQGTPPSFVQTQAEGYPYVPWVSKDLIARAVRNLDDAMKLAEDAVSRKRDSLLSFNFEVASQTQQRKYVVRLSKTCMLPLGLSESGTPVRDQISCGCPGYTVTLKKQNEDHVCKHCGAVLLACLKANRRVPLALADVPLPRARSPVRKATVQLDMRKALPQAAFAGMMADRRVTEPGAGCIGYGEHQRRREQLGKLKALEDVQSC